MNSNQIDIILKNNFYSKRYFIGVFSADTLPDVLNYPCTFVCNNKKLNEPGEHWLAFFIPNSETVEYFDSLAGEPEGIIKTYISKFKNIKTNRKPIQAFYETSCGPFTIYFVTHRSMGNSFETVLKKLSNKFFRDAYVKFFTANLL
jgi:hypothetical protein